MQITLFTGRRGNNTVVTSIAYDTKLRRKPLVYKKYSNRSLNTANKSISPNATIGAATSPRGVPPILKDPRSPCPQFP
jgi:hypothetical protein